MAIAPTGTADLPVPVLEGAHWRVVVRPGTFKSERIPTLAECWLIVERSRVALRGWDYPHADDAGRGQGNGWIGSWVDWRNHVEYWRLHQSGQFLHLSAFSEDEVKEDALRRVMEWAWSLPDGLTPTGHVEFIGALYRLTEIFEFAARLATAGVLDEHPVIEVGMRRIKGRVLMSTDSGRVGFGEIFQASEDSLGRAWETTSPDLIANSARLAVDATVWFFERFGWQDPPRGTLEREQAEFLARRTRRS